MALEIKIETAKDGTQIFVVAKNGKECRLNSSYRPVVEAKKFAEQFAKLPQNSVLLVFGYGNGLFAKAIMDACNKTTRVIFYEPCKAILQKVNIKQDMETFFEQKRCVLVTDEAVAEREKLIYSFAEFPRVLQDFVFFHNRKNVYFCSLPKYEEIFPEEYEIYWDMIEYHMQQIQANQETAKAIGHIAVENNIKILKYIPDSYCADSFIGLFPKDMPAIIVSAGPSLEKNVKELKLAKGRALVVCVDTAVKYLLKEDIIPDIIVSLDPRKELTLFDDPRISEIPLVGVADMSVKVLEKTNSKRFILASAENPYIQKLYADEGHEIVRLESGGSVATMAYSLCRYIGFQTVILVGQDLALTGNQMYAGKNKIEMKSFQRELIEVEDVHGNIIYTTRDYYYYLKWFEQVAELHQNVKIIDATEGGARIQGTSVMVLREAIETYGVDYCDIEGIINSVKPVFYGEKRKACKRKLKKDQEKWVGLVNCLERGLELASKGLQKIKRPGWLLSQEASTVSNNIMNICEELEKSDSYFLIMREIDATDLEHYLHLCEVQTEGVSADWFRLMQQYFECIIKAAKTVRNVYVSISFDD